MPDNQPVASGWTTPKPRRSRRNKLPTTRVTESRRSTETTDTNRYQHLAEEPRDLLRSLTDRADLEEIQFPSPQAAKDQEDPDSSPTESESDYGPEEPAGTEADTDLVQSPTLGANPSQTSDFQTDSDTDYDTDSDSDSDSDSDYEMTEKDSTKTILSYIKARKPEHGVPLRGKPSLIDKIAFRITLQGALASLPCPLTNTGYAWLIQDPVEYEEQYNEKPPKAPTYPGKANPTATREEKKIWKQDKHEYDDFKERLEELYTVLEFRFPGYLTRYTGSDRRVKPEHFHDPMKIVNERERANNGNKGSTIALFNDTQQQISTLKISPLTVDGLNTYFHTIEDLREVAKAIPIPVPVVDISWVYLKQVALGAISTSGFPLDKVQEYEDEWTMNVQSQFADKDGWCYFKEFYEDKIEILEKSTDLQTINGRANLSQNISTELKDQMDYITQENHDLRQHMNVLQAHLAKLGQPGETQPMATVVTGSTAESTMSALSAATLENATLLKALMAKFDNPTQSTGNQSTGKQNKDQWAQWNKWCYSCGVQLHHDSLSCPPNRKKKSDHVAKAPTATFNNKMGGNANRDHLWMKWCHPVTHKVHDTPTTT